MAQAGSLEALPLPHLAQLAVPSRMMSLTRNPGHNNKFREPRWTPSSTRVIVLRRQASLAADQVAVQVDNRYRAGQVGYTEVIIAQATALSARRALVQLMAERQSTAVALSQALGGGWQAD